MPVITRFYGLVIKMYLLGKEHDPPHFHVMYGEYNGVFDLRTLAMTEGDLPAKARDLALEWAKRYQNDMQEMWNTQNFRKLPPLE